jgi:hypothetical protein
MPKFERQRGLVAYVAGPVFIATALALDCASGPVEARAVDTIEFRPTAERRAQLVRTFDEKPERQTAETPSRETHYAQSPHRSKPLPAMLIALALSAAALARGAGLRLSRIATRIR